MVFLHGRITKIPRWFLGKVESSCRVARFEGFELDLRTGELRRTGNQPISLAEQPFRILTMLLERPVGLVTREEIRDALWPNGTIVEFEHSISAAMNRLRQVLGDSADQPQYIETLARRGYRWMVPVQWIETPSLPATVLSSAASAQADRTVSRKRLRLLIVSVAVVVATAIAASAYFFTHRTPKLTSKDPIILADFTNTTGDPVFDGTLRQGLVAQLEQSPYLNILSDEQIAGTLRLMSQPAGTRFTHDLARHVCQRTGGMVVLDGSIAQIGSQYQLILNASDCSTGSLLGSAQAVASDKNHVLGALGSVASAIRKKLGESLTSIQKFNTPLEEVTTPSLEALQAYTIGWRAGLSGDESAAVGSLERAISLDPNFAMAYAVLGTAYGGLGESGLAAANTQKAFDLRDRVSEREKFYISSHYEENVTGDLEKAIQVFELWAQTYPRDVVPVGHLSWHYAALGQYDQSLLAARRAFELAPDVELPYEVLASSYLNLDRLDDAAAILQQAKARGIDSPPLHELAYVLAFLKGDAAGMAREAAWAAGKPGTEDVLTELQSDTAAYAGHLTQANDLTARAVVSARLAGETEPVTRYWADAALREALVGNLAKARQQASAALRASSEQVTATLALARAGDLGRAQALGDDLGRRHPNDTIVQFYDLPTLHAQLALSRSEPSKAIEALQAAGPYEFGNMRGVYVRGEAFLAARRGSEAAGEFQKILDHRGIVLNGLIGALAHLQIGRAYVMQGDTAKAKAAYHDFLTLWKDADPDLPILQQAKAEYARLR
jgi:eukaryotic-like serine/threonine-protein kinase